MMSRTELTVEGSPQEFAAMFDDVLFRNKFDDKIREVKIIETLDANTKIFYIRCKTM